MAAEFFSTLNIYRPRKASVSDDFRTFYDSKKPGCEHNSEHHLGFSLTQCTGRAKRAARGADARKCPQGWACASSPTYPWWCSLSCLQEDAILILHICAIPFFLLNTRRSTSGWKRGWWTELQVISGNRQGKAGMEREAFVSLQNSNQRSMHFDYCVSGGNRE